MFEDPGKLGHGNEMIIMTKSFLIRLDGKPNRKNEAAFSNFSGRGRGLKFSSVISVLPNMLQFVLISAKKSVVPRRFCSCFQLAGKRHQHIINRFVCDFFCSRHLA